MSKNLPVRTLMDGQHVKGSETLLKKQRDSIFVGFFDQSERKSARNVLS